MKVAVLSLTRDRLDYTKHCFQTLRDNAGIDYDHHVWDNGSTDGTPAWLEREHKKGRIHSLHLAPQNQGIYGPLDTILDQIDGDDGIYDVIVNVDNDCELLVPDTLRTVAEIADAHPGWVIGPHTQGLRHPPQIIATGTVDGHRFGATYVIGGIFMPLPPGWRYQAGGQPYVHRDGVICQAARDNGDIVGYLLDFPVNHYETTDGQHARYPDYFARRVAEGIPD